MSIAKFIFRELYIVLKFFDYLYENMRVPESEKIFLRNLILAYSK